MLVIYHNNNRITKVVSGENCLLPFDNKKVISEGLYDLAVQFPESKIVWCNEELEYYLNLKVIDTVFHHNKLMLSYSPAEIDFLGRKIGYVEESPFIKINKKVSYPTWQMSSTVGVVHASLLLEIKDKIKMDADFDYYLNSVAKVCMPLGLLCYSEPQLLKAFEGSIVSTPISNYTLFKFVKQHYKKRWQILLLLNLIVFEKEFPLLPLIFSIFYKTRKNDQINLETIFVQSILQTTVDNTIDVIIPTIGRKKELYNVLNDLRNQTHLPINVIIVEQNPLSNSESELGFLHNEDWPFLINHTFTHQVGACNARNLALSQVVSEWVFLNDDDNRLEKNLLQDFLFKAEKFGAQVVTTSYLQKNEVQHYNTIHQSGIFGSGNSFVKKRALADIRFDMALEFGYGEDTDFGMQLRNKGFDIIYFPELRVLHLKAPFGGFRIKIEQLWEAEIIQPKPSPTVLYVMNKNNTAEQLSCYKLVLFLKLLKKQSLQSCFGFLKLFQKKWDVSLYWSNQLNKND